ncbi:MAG: ribosome silencing factor [Lachnospiraceae bacterium]|nr:ribosome silencing factor [Lachnospiraceae bacterium]
MTSSELARLAVKALEDKKAEDIRVLDIRRISTIADYFIIADGDNIHQVHALADNVEEILGRAGAEDPRVEGYAAGKWILLDYQDAIIHVFDRQDRLFYDLERIWEDGKVIDPKEL